MSPSGTPSSVKPSWFWLKLRTEKRVDHSLVPSALADCTETLGSFSSTLSGLVPGVAALMSTAVTVWTWRVSPRP